MEPGQLIFALLSQAAPVVALLGTRVFPILAPQQTPYPYLTYQVIDQTGESTMACALDDNARVQLSIFASSYAEVCAISAVTRAALAGYRQGAVCIDFDGNRDQPSDPTVCYFRTQDYLLELPAPGVNPAQPAPVLPTPAAPSGPATDPTTGELQFVLPAGYAFDTLQVEVEYAQ